MTIEIRQLLVKSTVLSREENNQGCNGKCVDPEDIKNDLLAECRQMLRELSGEVRER